MSKTLIYMLITFFIPCIQHANASKMPKEVQFSMIFDSDARDSESCVSAR